MNHYLRTGIAAVGVSAALWACGGSAGSSSSGGLGQNEADGGAGDAASGQVPDAPATCMADLATDARNCGRCGHDCLGGTCSAGRCQPVLISSFSNTNTTNSIASDGAHLYTVPSNGACPDRYPVKGGAREPAGCASGLTLVDSMAVDETGLFLLGRTVSDMAVYRIDKASKASSLVVNLGAIADGFAISGDSVYWWTSRNDANPNRLYMAPKTGGVPVALTAAGAFSGRPGAVVSGGSAYGTSPATYRLLSVSSSKVVNVFAPAILPQLLAVNGTTLAWFDEGDDALYTMPAPAGSPARLGTETSSVLGGLLMDETSVYWFDEQTSALKSQPLAGGPSVELAGRVPTLFGHFAMDATSLYWTDDVGLERLAK